MTPEISIRTFTDDQYILDKVFYANNYRLKQLPEKEKVTVLDIGAHIGTFSLLCLMRGADKVYSVEPFGDNYRVMGKNLEAFSDKASLLRMGVYTETRFAQLEYPKNENNFFYLAHVGLHSDGDSVPSDLSFFVTLDELLTSIPETEIDLMKISIGYAEADILMSSERVGKCNFVCLEAKLKEDKLGQLVEHMKSAGFQDSFFAESKEVEGSFLLLFAKTKCEELFNLFVSGTPEGDKEEEQQMSAMTQFPEGDPEIREANNPTP
jgi:FkbM family methyltransferase